MPNRTELRDLVRVQTLVESDDLTDAKVDNLFNQAIRDVSVRFPWPFLAASTTIAVTNATDTYALPSDVDRIEVLLKADYRQPLFEQAASSAFHIDGATPSTGSPSWFFLWGESIVLRPQPDGNETLTLYYYKKPTMMTDDSHTPEWAEQFHYLITDFVMQQLWEREEDFEKGNVYRERYLQGVESMARFYLNRKQDSPLVIGQPGETWARRGPRQPWLEV